MQINVRHRNRNAKRRPHEPELTWEIARFFPAQGDWTEDEFFALESTRLVEYVDGTLEFLPEPTIFHQLVLQFLFKELDAFVAADRLGIVVVSGYKVRLRGGKYREPDILFVKAGHLSRIKKQYCERADLVVEVVSEENRKHDIKTKQADHARAGIREYWIVDPERGTITVLVLKPRQKTYVEFGVFRDGDRAVSKILPGFGVPVKEVLAQRPC